MPRLDTSGVPEELRKAIVAEYFDDLRARKRAERMAKDARPRQPSRGRYKAVASGAYKRKLRPQFNVEDRAYVPAALNHWRKVHNLTQRQAQARIGYSPRSSTWRHYESGFVAPPYRTLLAIIAATGLGFWVDDNAQAGLGDLRLDAQRSEFQARIRRRRAARKVTT